MNLPKSQVPRHIILSRKGFDSGYGRCASPIIESRLLSLPIPESHFRPQITYRELTLPPGPWAKVGKTFGDLICALPSRGGDRAARPDSYVHLDPDIRLNIGPRTGGRARHAMFGQCCTADVHLHNPANGPVGTGDLFLFFGWFRHAEVISERKIRFTGRDMHVIWGWLQVEDCVEPRHLALSNGEYCHPHFLPLHKRGKHVGGRNSVYRAAHCLTFDPSVAGFGVFEMFTDGLRLTPKDALMRSVWEVPAWFEGRLSNMGKKVRWEPRGEWRRVQRKGHGQEFILCTAGIECEVRAWLTGLLQAAPRRATAAGEE